MKKFKLIFGISLFTLNVNFVISQATTGMPLTGNVYAANRFLGWNTNSGNLNFRTNNVNDLNPYAVFSCYCSPLKSSFLAN